MFGFIAWLIFLKGQTRKERVGNGPLAVTPGDKGAKTTPLN